ncbi:MAG: ssDNA-binding domain-containing protein [Christensenellaceae bacterium]|jgi:antirestriction protein ArdC|nr:ssDNA-binding domain-containing protein [Christensenellaceae bacterium]
MNEINDGTFNQMLMRLTERQQATVLNVLENLEKNNSLMWKQGWSFGNNPDCYGSPMNPITKVTYSGINSICLTTQGYSDPRWLTLQQIEKAGYIFRDGLSDEVLKRGVKIEFSLFYDRQTKKPFDQGASNIATMSPKDRSAYIRENVVRPFRSYTVYNASLLENITPFIVTNANKIKRDEALEAILSASEAPIYYDGYKGAYYSLNSDTIHLPPRGTFKSASDFYGVALHEIGHSTGHGSRLKRNLGYPQNSEPYALEELRAEFASIVIGAKYGLSLTDEHIKNHAAYIANWRECIIKDPLSLINALKDACKIAQYVEGFVKAKSKPQEKQKQIIAI